MSPEVVGVELLLSYTIFKRVKHIYVFDIVLSEIIPGNPVDLAFVSDKAVNLFRRREFSVAFDI